jgi:hypothetical protein
MATTEGQQFDNLKMALFRLTKFYNFKATEWLTQNTDLTNMGLIRTYVLHIIHHLRHISHRQCFWN